jgi:hypothetical protein
MKERKRWRFEEDSMLHAYVKRYWPREWNLVSQRMNRALDRDPEILCREVEELLEAQNQEGLLIRR